MPSVAWGVNIPADGPQADKLVVAAYGDGTIRWHRLRDGQELLAFFPHADRQRWVLWTPSGYYDASPGGEELFGWHLNRLSGSGALVRNVIKDRPAARAGVQRGDVITQVDGAVVATIEDLLRQVSATPQGKSLRLTLLRSGQRQSIDVTPALDAESGSPRIGIDMSQPVSEVQASDFYPASRFRSRFYRPDVIDRVLDTLDEAEALKQADVAANRRTEPAPSLAQLLPPVVELLSPAELRATSAQVTLRVLGRSAADAPVTAWRVRINGELAPERRGLARQAAGSADARELQVSVPPRDSDITVFAENRHGVSSAATVRVTWAGAAPVPDVVKPRLYVLAIGVGQYQHKDVVSLGALPAKDARDFVAAIQRQQGRLYESVEVKLLTDAQASRDNVVDGLEWLQRKPRQFDVSMLFVSGHGINDPSMGYLFLPHNADPDALKRTAVNWGDFKSTVVAMAGKRIVFMDTCHAGNALGTSFKTPYTDIGGVVADLAATENGVVVFASSTGRQLSIQNPAWGNGAFTMALVEGLNGAAGANPRNEITHKRLSVYVSDRVRTLTGGRQAPVNPDPVGVPDFALAVK